MKNKTISILGWIWILGGFLLACSPELPSEPVRLFTDTPTETVKPFLTPYFTRTATVTSTPPDPATPTPFPTPTSTPRTHVVRQGEDMLGIALRYGLTLAELLLANPDVDPNLISVDTVISIPASNQEAQPESDLPSPTAAAASLGEPLCWRSAEGGAWCFVPVENSSELALESVSALVRLADGRGSQVAQRTALTPLNLIPAGGTLPLFVYFPAPVPEPFQVNAVLQTAFPVQSPADRYLDASIINRQVEISPDGGSARLSGEITLSQSALSASLVWVAAVAYDTAGDVVGVRRWESSTSLTADERMPFEMFVYSMGGAIARVDLLVEARL